MVIIDGKKLAEKIKNKIVKEIIAENQGDIYAAKRPSLAIILVGEKEDSKLYVSLKEREAKKCGIDTHMYKFGEDDDENEIKQTVEFLNNDEKIDAILLQLPLPAKFNTDKIVKLIKPEKDLDGFHPENLKKICSDIKNDFNLPPLFQVILEIFKSENFEFENKEVCVLSNSDIFGSNLKKVLEKRGAKVYLGNPTDNKWKKTARTADILITAVGRKQFIKKEDIKEGAFLIDIGISQEDKKIYGDIDLADVKNKAGYVTPVPGGVGPLTIAMALKNTLEKWKKNKL